MQEYWVLFIPVFLAMTVIIYFIYHIRHTEKYSRLILRNIEEKVRTIEELNLETSHRTRELLSHFKKALKRYRKKHLFELEREMGIDMGTFTKKLEKELKKKERCRL